MKTRTTLFSLVLLTAIVLTACGGTATPDALMEKAMPTADAMMEKETPTADAMMGKETPTADAMMGKETPAVDAMMESPAWYAVSLVDSRTSQTFSINDFKGKVVLVETIAVWCSSCFRQQEQINALHGLLADRDDFVSLSIDIDPNENADVLNAYVNKTGFDWHYAVAPADVSSEIAALYGDQFLNPPSTPILIIDRKGMGHPLPFGIKSADELLKFIQPFLDEAM